MTEVRTRPARELPDLDAEQEVDLGQLRGRLASHWWLLAAGLVAGALIGYALSFGGGKSYSAKALVYLGNPISFGGSPLPSLAANPRYVREVVDSEAAIRSAARVADVRPGQVRGHISTAAASATGTTALGTGRVPQTLVTITAKGSSGPKTAAVANAVAAYVVNELAAYAKTKISTFKEVLRTYRSELASLERRIAALTAAVQSGGVSPIDKVVLVGQLDSAEQRRGDVIAQQAETRQQLTQAQQIEEPRIVERAIATETTARSRRNSLLVGAILGLIAGGIAALLWDRLAPAFGRRPAL